MKATLALFVGLLVPVSALAQARAGIVTTLEGHVTVARGEQPVPLPLKFMDDVFLGDRITTSSRALLRALLGGKAVLTMRELSTLTISEPAPERSTIALDSGKVVYAAANERMRPGEVHEVRTPNAIVRIRGTIVIVEVMTPVVTRVCVIAGTASVRALGGPSVDVGPTQSVTVRGDVLDTRLSRCDKDVLGDRGGWPPGAKPRRPGEIPPAIPADQG